MSFCIYLTHPEVQIDPALPVPQWGLSDVGRERAGKALLLPWAKEIRHVISSAENKAVETAEIFAGAFGLSNRAIESLHENDRSATGFLKPREFEEVANAFFAHPDTSVRGWEKAADAQARIVDGVRQVLSSLPENEPALFCGHGAAGTLLKCHLMGIQIDRRHDQKRGGCWYRFSREALTEQNSAPLDWIML